MVFSGEYPNLTACIDYKHQGVVDKRSMASASHTSSTAQQELNNLAKSFEVTDESLRKLTQGFLAAFRTGLQTPHQEVTMGPSWVTHEAEGTEEGSFLVIDISWSTFFVAQIKLDGKRSFTSASHMFEIDKEFMHADATVFFDLLAQGIKTFLEENNIRQEGLYLGFTFPFAMEKDSIHKANILAFSKGFDVQNAVGKDVCELLQTALDKANTGVKLVAVVNDVVAALLSESYIEMPCIMSAIYGVGTNASYLESGSALTKLTSFTGDKMVVNTEWGAFNDTSLLHPTDYDRKVDDESPHPGHYGFQKMMTWYYVGEIARFILLDFVSKGLLFNGVASETLKKVRHFPALMLYRIEDVDLLTEGLSAVKEIISETLDYSIESLTDSDAEITRRICTIVSGRSGRLAGAPFAALLDHLGYSSGSGSKEEIPIAVDGEMFLGSNKFESLLKQSIATIAGKDVQERLVFHRVKQGGIVGTAIAAYDAVNHHGHAH